MNVTESATSFNSLSNWLKPESCQSLHGPEIQCSSEEGDQQSEYSPQPPPSNQSPQVASTEEADEEATHSTATTLTNSYSMKDLLAHETCPLTSSPQQMSLKRKYEDDDNDGSGFIAELSRNTADALTRALCKRTTFAEQTGCNLESELKGIVREALEASLENMNRGNSLLGAEVNKKEEEDTKCIDYSKKHEVEKKVSAFEKNSPLPEYIPPPTVIMDAIGSSGFGQSFSVYYEAACRMLQMQRGSQEFPKINEIIPQHLIKTMSDSPRLPLGTRNDTLPPSDEMLTAVLGIQNQLLNQKQPKISPVMVNRRQETGEHQTEALSLVVNSNKPSFEPGCFLPASQSFSFYQDHLNQSMIEAMHTMPRRKRTKVTDTRLVSKSNRMSIPSPESNLIMQLQNCDLPYPSRLPSTSEQKEGELFLPYRLSNAPPQSQYPIRFDPALMSDILKSLSMGAPFPQLHQTFPKERPVSMIPPPPISTVCSTTSSTRNLFFPNIPPLDFIGSLPPFCYNAGTSIPFSTPSTTENHLHHHHNQHQMTHNQHQTLRHNRSVGSKRVTNTLSNTSASTFGSNCMLNRRGGMGEEGSIFSMKVSQGLHQDLEPMSNITSTLTPIHLRKAKLMFFFTRYPNSSLLKIFFSDVKFNKNNTAQLVKWFSNFREFYYIQMEKYARVAISEGVRSASEITVTTGSELYRALAVHYNRNQQIEIPDFFRVVVETTLKEFFVALSSGKDSEQSWKKPIYKIIACMDQPVPDYFKNPNWMAQLADG